MQCNCLFSPSIIRLATKGYTSHVQYKVWHAVTQPGVSDIGPEAWTTFLSVIGAP
jgi:hypothetical protein